MSWETPTATTTKPILVILFDVGTFYSNIFKLPGFPGILPDVVTKACGYPDLIIGGPGFKFPLWKWKTDVNVFGKKIKEADLKKLKTKNIETISKKYTEQSNRNLFCSEY